MSSRWWRAYLLWGELHQRATRHLRPGSLRYVPHGWPLRPGECPCDLDFCDFLETRAIRGRRIFHFGTGGHHLVGLRNHEAGWRNDVLGITISPREHARYVRRVIREPALALHYKVLFADIHSLHAASLPGFDVVTLFHLCEFCDPASAGRRLDDAGLLRLFIGQLAAGGWLLLYRGSFGYARAAPLVAAAVDAGHIAHAADFRSLSIYRRGALPVAP